MEFASLMASLRAPRVAIAIPEEGWQYFASRGLEFFSRTWGGAGGVLVPVSKGQIPHSVARLLRRYDPDYITTLEYTIEDKEALEPGWPIEVNGRILEGQQRQEFLSQIKEYGPKLIHARRSPH
jgi:hypothetical protein